MAGHILKQMTKLELTSSTIVRLVEDILNSGLHILPTLGALLLSQNLQGNDMQNSKPPYEHAQLTRKVTKLALHFISAWNRSGY